MLLLAVEPFRSAMAAEAAWKERRRRLPPLGRLVRETGEWGAADAAPSVVVVVSSGKKDGRHDEDSSWLSFAVVFLVILWVAVLWW